MVNLTEQTLDISRPKCCFHCYSHQVFIQCDDLFDGLTKVTSGHVLSFFIIFGLIESKWCFLDQLLSIFKIYVKVWMELVANESSSVWQQDKAPAKTLPTIPISFAGTIYLHSGRRFGLSAPLTLIRWYLSKDLLKEYKLKVLQDKRVSYKP